MLLLRRQCSYSQLRWGISPKLAHCALCSSFQNCAQAAYGFGFLFGSLLVSLLLVPLLFKFKMTRAYGRVLMVSETASFPCSASSCLLNCMLASLLLSP